MKKTTLAVALVATLALPLTAFAQGAGGGGGGAGGGGAGAGGGGAGAGGGGAGAGGSGSAGASQADTAPGAPGIKGEQMGNAPAGAATKRQTTGASRGNISDNPKER